MQWLKPKVPPTGKSEYFQVSEGYEVVEDSIKVPENLRKGHLLKGLPSVPESLDAEITVKPTYDRDFVTKVVKSWLHKR